MSFYSSISKAYDSIFPLKPVQTEFVESCFNGSVAGKKIIDAGCGTGSLAILLARRSARVFGFDSDSEMINLAREKQPQALNLKFRAGDLIRDLYAFEENKIDGIICFGNTLVHLTDLKDTEQFIKRSSEILKKNGKLLLQIVNYDRILKERVDTLPAITSGNYSFARKYNFQPDGLIDFETILTDNVEEKSIVNHVSLIPLRKHQLEKMLSNYFREIRFYGNFKKGKWGEDTFHLVVEALK